MLLRTILSYAVVAILLMGVAGCTRTYDGRWNPPLLYKIDVQQGNVIDQAMLDKLQLGMDQEKVRFILGSPLLVGPFHNDRWDYLYSYQTRGGIRKQRHISLHFEEEKLIGIDGDVSVPGWNDTTVTSTEESESGESSDLEDDQTKAAAELAAEIAAEEAESEAQSEAAKAATEIEDQGLDR